MPTNLGVGAGLGALLGVALIWWIEPSNAGGKGLLLFISIAACTTVGGILSLLFGKKKKPDDKRKDNSKSDEETSNDQTRDDGT